MLTNAAKVYQNNKVETATPAELTLMLYEGAVKFCNKASYSLEDKDMAKVNLNIIKTEKIITHLRATLDNNYPVAKDFDRMYDYIYDRLLAANIRKDKEILDEVTSHLRGIRDTWKEVIKQAK